MTTTTDPRLHAGSLMLQLLEQGDWEDGDVMRSHLWNQLNHILQEPSPASYSVISGTQGFRTSPTEVSVSIDGDVLARVVEHATDEPKPL